MLKRLKISMAESSMTLNCRILHQVLEALRLLAPVLQRGENAKREPIAHGIKIMVAAPLLTTILLMTLCI